MWKWLKNALHPAEAEVQYAALVEAPPSAPTVYLHSCGHWAASYAADPRTGLTECLPCHNIREGYIRNERRR